MINLAKFILSLYPGIYKLINSLSAKFYDYLISKDESNEFGYDSNLSYYSLLKIYLFDFSREN